MPQRVETVEQFFERVNKREDAIEREMGIDGSRVAWVPNSGKKRVDDKVRFKIHNAVKKKINKGIFRVDDIAIRFNVSTNATGKIIAKYARENGITKVKHLGKGIELIKH